MRISILRIDLPSHRLRRSSPEGRAFLLTDCVSYLTCISSVSPACASKRIRQGFPLGGSHRSRLKGQGMESAAFGRQSLYSAPPPSSRGLPPRRESLPDYRLCLLSHVHFVSQSHMCLKTCTSRLPPRGSWPEGPERAKDGIPAARGRLFPLPALSPLRGALPEGEPAGLSFSSFIPGIFCRLASICALCRTLCLYLFYSFSTCTCLTSPPALCATSPHFGGLAFTDRDT